MSELTTGSYQRHYYWLGSVIRNTVSQAQDTLHRLQLGRERQHITSLLERYYCGGNYPQSLGELCIELAQKKITHPAIKEWSDGNWVYKMTTWHPLNHELRRDIQKLRETLYHTYPRLDFAVPPRDWGSLSLI